MNRAHSNPVFLTLQKSFSSRVKLAVPLNERMVWREMVGCFFFAAIQLFI